jgi:hypothetical protein
MLSGLLFLSNRCTVRYSKKNVKIYIKINIKRAPACFGLNNHLQGTWHLCLAKVVWTETCRSTFNVNSNLNFNIFLGIFNCGLLYKNKKLDSIKLHGVTVKTINVV